MNSETYYGINQPIAPECSALQALRRCFYIKIPERFYAIKVGGLVCGAHYNCYWTGSDIGLR